jgi:hypothetical protein
MEATKPMTSVGELPNRPAQAPGGSPNDAGRSAEQRPSVAALGRHLPETGKPEGGRAVR